MHLLGKHKGTTETWETNNGWVIEAFCCWDCGKVEFIKTYPVFN
jgi:hypothetical protein